MTRAFVARTALLCGAALAALWWLPANGMEPGAAVVPPAGPAVEPRGQVRAGRGDAIREPGASRLPTAPDSGSLRTVTGRVVDGAGLALPGALVVVEARGVAAAPQATDPAGRFAVAAEIPEAAAARVSASCPGHCPAFATVAPVAGAAVVAVPDLVLGAGGTLVGRLADPGGVPVAAAHVTVSAGGQRAAWEQDSDRLGQFRIVLLPCAPLSLHVSAPGAQRRALPVLPPLFEGEVRDLGTLVLAPGRTIRGVVRTVDGAPVGDAEVACAAVDAATRTDGEGRFALAELPAGAVALRACAPGLVEAEQVCDAAASLVTLVLAPGVTLRGALWSEATQGAVADGVVALVRLCDLTRPVPVAAAWGTLVPHTTVAAVTGRFTCQGLGPGQWALCATAPAHAATWVGPIAVCAGAAGIEQDVFLAEGFTVAGEVQTADGRPLADATVQLLEPLPAADAAPGRAGDRFLDQLAALRADAEVRCLANRDADPLGRFSFAGVPRKPLRVLARAPGFAPAAVPLTPGAPERTVVRLWPEAQLHGVVLGIRRDESGVQVVLVGGAGRCRVVDVDAGGSYRLAGVEPGRYLLRAVRGPAERGLLDLMARVRAGEPDLVTPDLELAPGQDLLRDVPLLEPALR